MEIHICPFRALLELVGLVLYVSDFIHDDDEIVAVTCGSIAQCGGCVEVVANIVIIEPPLEGV